MQIVAVVGRLVRDPITRRAVGADPISINPNDPYWVRLLNDGDVAVAPETPIAPEQAPAVPSVPAPVQTAAPEAPEVAVVPVPTPDAPPEPQPEPDPASEATPANRPQAPVVASKESTK